MIRQMVQLFGTIIKSPEITWNKVSKNFWKEVEEHNYSIPFILKNAKKAYDIFWKERADFFLTPECPAFIEVYGNILYRQGKLYIVSDTFNKNITNAEYLNSKYDNICLIKVC